MATLVKQKKYYEQLLDGQTKVFKPKKLKNVKPEVQKIEPLEAKHILKHYNTNNRKPSKLISGKYAKDMLGGNWKMTGQSISFSVDGKLIDGQHRLMACVESGKPMETIVSYGVDPNSFDVTDNGKTRTNADVLDMLGYTDPNALAALVRSIIAYEQSGSPDTKKGKRFDGNNTITKSQIIDFLNERPDVADYVERYKKNNLVSVSIAAFCYWLFTETHDKSLAEEYLDKVFLGINLSENTIEYYLHRKLQRNKMSQSQTSMNKNSIVANVILGWRRFMGYSKSKALQLNWDTRYGFPDPCKK